MGRAHALLIAAVCALAGCRDSADVCKHYSQKSYRGKKHGGLEPPKKAVKACTARCKKSKNIRACTTAARWYKVLGDVERMVEMRDRACEYGDKGSCNARAGVERSKRRAAYNQQASALRRELAACMKDPNPCERKCDAGDINACMQLADRAHIGFKGYGKKPALARTYYQRVCDMHDTTYYCWQPFIVPSAICARPDNRPPCDVEEEGYCPPAPKPRPGCAEIHLHDKLKDRDVRKHLAVCNGQRACDTILRSTCLSNVDLCKKACDEHDDGARCRQIAAMYKKGLGLPADPALAAKYSEKACSLGDKWPCKKYDKTRRYLKPRPLPGADTPAVPKQAEREPNR